MFFKKVMTIEDFVNTNYLPFINDILVKEFDSLQFNIANNSSFEVEPKSLLFELYILLFYLSGRGLSTIKGFEVDNKGLYNMQRLDELTDQGIIKTFPNFKLNKKWINEDEDNPLIDELSNYRKYKSKAYRKYELSFYNNEINEDELRKQICKIFFSIENDEVDVNLIRIMGELHEKCFMYIFRSLIKFSKEYKLS